MKKILIISLAVVLFVGIFTACSSYDFDQEQYKKEINLLSNSELVYDRQVADLKGNGDTIFLVAGLSGSVLSNETYNVGIMEADSLFRAYNKSNFDIEKDRYARKLPEECFTFPYIGMQIPAGKSQVKFPIYLQNLDKLSPDSIYLLDYKIDPVTTSVFNPKKQEVLLRLFFANEFATTRQNTFYNYTSSSIITLDINSPLIKHPTNANQVFPLGENCVRMLAGDETFDEYKKALDKINRMSIKVTIGDKTSQNPLARVVTIEPYKTLDVVQMTPFEVYSNTYLINIISTPDGRKTYYKEFRLHYKYRLTATDPYKEVKAILRMEYNPRTELL